MKRFPIYKRLKHKTGVISFALDSTRFLTQKPKIEVIDTYFTKLNKIQRQEFLNSFSLWLSIDCTKDEAKYESRVDHFGNLLCTLNYSNTEFFSYNSKETTYINVKSYGDQYIYEVNRNEMYRLLKE